MKSRRSKLFTTKYNDDGKLVKITKSDAPENPTVFHYDCRMLLLVAARFNIDRLHPSKVLVSPASTRDEPQGLHHLKDVVSLPKCLMLGAIQFRGGAYNSHESTHPTTTTNQEAPKRVLNGRVSA